MKDKNDKLTKDIITCGNPVGRPRKHNTAAARQQAYRLRLKQAGYREVSKIIKDVRDHTKPLKSSIIDLSPFRISGRKL